MRRAAAALAALTLLRLVVAALLPLTPDEAYYWVWSRALAPGYVDHPPMVALFIRIGIFLGGETPLGVRLLGPLAAVVETWMLADAAARWLGDRRAGLVAGVLWNATLLVGAGSILMTPDTPLLLFWCATLWAMMRLATGGGAGWWLVAGAAAGLALGSKYTAAFLWIGVGLWVLLVPPARAWSRHAAFWAGALLGAALFLPVLAWNADHGWVSFLKQGGRVTDWHTERAAAFLAELVGGQIGLATPIVWALCVAGLARLVWRGHKTSSLPSEPACLLLALSAPPALVFLQHAFGDRVQGNWPAIIYPAGVIAAAALAHPAWRRLIRPAAWLGFGLTALVLSHALMGVLPLPPRTDPTVRLLAGWGGLTDAVDAIRRRESATYVAAEEYALIAELAWNAPAGLAVIGLDPRLAPMSLPRGSLNGRTGLLLRAEHRGEDIDPTRWETAAFLGFIERTTPRGVIERYRLWRVSGRGEGVNVPNAHDPHPLDRAPPAVHGRGAVVTGG